MYSPTSQLGGSSWEIALDSLPKDAGSFAQTHLDALLERAGRRASRDDDDAGHHILLLDLCPVPIMTFDQCRVQLQLLDLCLVPIMTLDQSQGYVPFLFFPTLLIGSSQGSGKIGTYLHGSVKLMDFTTIRD